MSTHSILMLAWIATVCIGTSLWVERVADQVFGAPLYIRMVVGGGTALSLLGALLLIVTFFPASSP
jgi:hypothetical protein